MRSIFATVGFGTALLTVIGQAQAGLTFFTDQSLFDTAVGGATLNFESFETPFATSATIFFADFTLSGDQVIVSIPTGGFTAVPTDGANTFGIVDNNFNGNLVTFSFSSPINVFSIDTIGPLNFSGAGSVTMSNNNGASQIIATAPPPLTNSTVVFGGLIDGMTTFNSVSIFTSQAGDGVQFDSLKYGLVDFGQTPDPTPVPEPASLALFSVGLSALGFAARRRRKSA